MASSEVSELLWADRLRQLLVPVLQHRLERNGIEATGAYNYYKVRLDRGELLQEYELAIARELIRRKGSVNEVVEVGSGFGQLVFLLAWNGFGATGIEFNRDRARMAEDLRAIVSIADSGLSGRISLFEGKFPLANLPPPGPQSLIVTTNLVATHTLAEQKAFVSAMRAYTYALVDIQRLFESRATEEEQQPALDLFVEAGYGPPELFLSLGAAGKYYLFKS